MIKIGFTGTRNGMSVPQENSIIRILKNLTKDNPLQVHHGDCVGADADMHDIAEHFYIPITIWPPEKQDLRAFCKNYAILKEEANYFQRNKNIVDNTDVLLGCPPTEYPLNNGGTWYTINYAKKKKKHYIYITPSGEVVESNVNGLSLAEKLWQ